MTSELCCLGYTAREAAFLTAAGLQSGYFTRRQFNAHIGRECGALGQRFIARAARLGHIEALPGYGTQQLYHLCARSFYGQLGEPGNRNRRLHAPETVRQRLMMLDYVADCPGKHWLLMATERQEALSGLLRPNATGAHAALIDEIVADRQPLFLDVNGNLHFAFVDAGLRGFSKWERFLKKRRPLLRAEPAVVTYASCSASRFPVAESLFRRMVGEDTVTGSIDRERLRGYFAARHLFEERRFESFDKQRLDRFREDQRTYTGDAFESLYQSWRHEGDTALSFSAPATARFETHMLSFSYAWLSPVRFQERKVRYGPDFTADQKGS